MAEKINHEAHEEHEDDPFSMKRMRAASPLSTAEEQVMRHTIGCAIEVHRSLGPGYLDSIDQTAMSIELGHRRMAFERERSVYVNYRGTEIPGQRVDLIIEGLMVVELKAVVRLEEVHRAQVISYLRTTRPRGGLLVNFRVRLRKDGLQRIVLT